jgi:hypothetical protein
MKKTNDSNSPKRQIGGYIIKSNGQRREGFIAISDELDLFSKPLIGQQLKSIEKHDYTWCFNFTGDVLVSTESSWRLIDKDHIVVTSDDHGQQFGLPVPVDAVSRTLSCTVNRNVEAATISPLSGDLIIEFHGQVQLQFLQMSCGYESWHLYFKGSETHCTGGGTIVHFTKT